MQWIEHFELFLFDFDGLLVNTERLHFAAYQALCAQRGFTLPWSFSQFCKAAHLSAEGLKEGIYKELPALFRMEPRWEVLYQEKKEAYEKLLEKGELTLMPGAALLLQELEKKGKKRAVVTNSFLCQIQVIWKFLPILKTIPLWITREDYTHPKPAPECYLKAIKKLQNQGDRVIGFEDSIRGLTALRGTAALPLLICPEDHSQMEAFQPATFPRAYHFASLEKIPEDFSDWGR